MYVQDTITKGNWSFNLGIRGDFYNGLTVARQAEPRLGIAYNIKSTGTVAHVSYARTLETRRNMDQESERLKRDSEILLGAAMQLLHQTPVLTSETIRTALDNFSPKKSKVQSQPVKVALSASQLADQLQQIKITPQFLSFEDMSKLWSALQARYRPSVCYQVSAVVIGQQEIVKMTA
jgi:hypothetical protein